MVTYLCEICPRSNDGVCIFAVQCQLRIPYICRVSVSISFVKLIDIEHPRPDIEHRDVEHRWSARTWTGDKDCGMERGWQLRAPWLFITSGGGSFPAESIVVVDRIQMSTSVLNVQRNTVG